MFDLNKKTELAKGITFGSSAIFLSM